MYATSTIVHLAEASVADRAMLGGKAATLAELSAAGFAVPPGIVVTAGALDEPDLDGQLHRAAAVVTDSGTLAAHASLVAREYGLPAVVGTGDATHQLLTGQIVTVDGTAGTITLHAAA